MQGKIIHGSNIFNIVKGEKTVNLELHTPKKIFQSNKIQRLFQKDKSLESLLPTDLPIT